MYLRRITQFTSSSSAKLLSLSTTSTTSSALLQNKNYYTSTPQMMRAASASAAQAAARLPSPKKFSSRHVHASSNFFSSKKTRGFQQKRSFSLTTRAMGAKLEIKSVAYCNSVRGSMACQHQSTWLNDAKAKRSS